MPEGKAQEAVSWSGMASHRGELGLLIDVAQQLRADDGRPESELHRRDRAVGLAIDARRLKPRAMLQSWLQRVTDDGENVQGRRVDSAIFISSLVLPLLGVLAGVTTATAVFHYDGTLPVNVLKVLAVFVLLQVVLLMLTVVVILPAGLRRIVPGLDGMQDALSMLSPGRLIVPLMHLLPQTWREAFARLRAGGEAHHRLFAGVYKWLVLQGSQQFAVGFNVGALLGAMALVMGTDLAFGWSTTLQLRAEDVYRWTRSLSLPWWWMPQAQASVELIEVTRFYRTPEGGVFDVGLDGNPRTPGGWWPFLVMCIIMYGLLPRLILMYVARRRLTRAIERALTLLPGAAELRDRLQRPWIETGSQEQEDATNGGPHTLREAQPGSDIDRHRRTVAINWSNVPVSAEALRTTLAPQVVEAGQMDLAMDRRAIEAAQVAGEGAAAIVVRAWEPPLMDLVDFIVELRRAMGEGRPIHVVPVNVGADGRLAAASKNDLAIWRRKMATVGDPWLKVADAPC